MTEKERIEAREAEAQALRNNLVAEYHELTSKIVSGEARLHQTYAKRYSGLDEIKINDELSQQLDCMKGYRSHLMRRMALLGIDLKAVVN